MDPETAAALEVEAAWLTALVQRALEGGGPERLFADPQTRAVGLDGIAALQKAVKNEAPVAQAGPGQFADTWLAGLRKADEW